MIGKCRNTIFAQQRIHTCICDAWQLRSFQWWSPLTKHSVHGRKHNTLEKYNNVLLLHPFNSLFSRTTWVIRHQKGKPFWILLQQEMMGWQWYQLDHMQIICTSLQTDNHVSTSPLKFLQAGCPSLPPNQQRHSTEGWTMYLFVLTQIRPEHHNVNNPLN